MFATPIFDVPLQNKYKEWIEGEHKGKKFKVGEKIALVGGGMSPNTFMNRPRMETPQLVEGRKCDPLS